MEILYYVHDPMCSWCWGFRPTWLALREQLAEQIDIRYVLGGLAQDTHELMPVSMQQQIISTWQRIQKEVPSTVFNFDFWRENEPRRSTYPACRAVIAASFQRSNMEDETIQRIQQAYYLQAKNPSDDAVLIQIAKDMNLDVEQFAVDLHHSKTRTILKQNIEFSHSMGANSFPSLILAVNDACHPIAISYVDIKPMLEHIRKILL